MESPLSSVVCGSEKFVCVCVYNKESEYVISLFVDIREYSDFQMISQINLVISFFYFLFIFSSYFYVKNRCKPDGLLFSRCYLKISPVRLYTKLIIGIPYHLFHLILTTASFYRRKNLASG